MAKVSWGMVARLLDRGLVPPHECYLSDRDLEQDFRLPYVVQESPVTYEDGELASLVNSLQVAYETANRIKALIRRRAAAGQ